MPARTTWIAFLRAINLGAHNKIAMADLRELLSSLGYDDVRTLLQSGNAVFVSGRKAAGKIEQELSAAIERAFGFDVPVLARTVDELGAVVDANPFLPSADPKELHAAFLAKAAPAGKVKALDPAAYAPDEFAFGDRVVYLRRPKGFQASRLPDWRKVLGVDVTERNWNTVSRVHALAGG